MTERIIDFVRELIGNDYLTTILISIIPIVELRGAIPAAITMGLSAGVSFALAWIGSALVSPILLLILRPILNWMKKYKAFASLANAVESGFKSKAMKVVGENNGQLTAEQAKKLERKKMLGVYLFVAFPIPLTGVWTGSAVATFLDIPFWKSMAMVWLGNLTAGAIVTVLAVFLKNHMNTVLDIFFVIVILVLLLYIVRVVVKMVKNKKNKNMEASEERAKEELNIQDSIDTEEEKSMTSSVVEERNAIDESVTAKVSESQKEEKK
ncbi:MAG: small multi-drug export protein [Clostridia bacterium]|nr:small multi-drug export protein [Clostridia bacterium]